MQYTDEQRAEALDLYVQLGTAETARRLGVPPRTVRYWASQADLAAARSQALEKGGEILALTHAKLRQELHLLLLERQIDALERIDQVHIEYKAAGSDLHRLEHETATSSDIRNYAAVVKDLNAVYRLELGESTSRPEITGLSVVDRELMRTLEEWHRADAPA